MPTQIVNLPQMKSCHDVETDIHRELTAQPGMTVSSLVVRRMHNGVCLEGVVHLEDESLDICETVRRVAGATRILNRLVVCRECETF